MRVLGDLYVKSEFRAHRSVENPVHIVRPGCRYNFGMLNANGVGMLDRLLDRVAAVRAAIRRRDLGGGISWTKAKWIK